MNSKEELRIMMETHVREMTEYIETHTAAERYRPASAYWELSVPTYMEQWPDDLHSLSIPSTQIKLSLDEARTLGSYIVELGEGFENVPENHETLRDLLIARLDSSVRQYPNGVFVRLGSRSPKDSFYWGMNPDNQLPNGQLKTGQQAFDLLTCCSERVYEDLQVQLSMNYRTSIWLRRGIAIDDYSEFRCFMQDRKLIGISQYFYQGVYPEITENAGSLKWAIEQFFEKQFRDASHLDSVVFDVFVKHRGGACPSILTESHGYEVKLLEINPFFNLTDPCLFDWNKPEEFQGQLRFKSELGTRTMTTSEV